MQKARLDMDPLQWCLPLPKTYRLSLLLRIGFLVAGMLFISLLLVAFVALLIGIHTSQIPPGLTFLLVSISVYLSPFILLVSCLSLFSLFRLRLDLLQEGMLFFALGQRLFIPWSTITVFHDRGQLQEVELQQAAEKISVEEGRRRHVAAHEVAWWYRWWLGRRPTYFFPLPRIFGEPAWDIGEISLYVRKYAPQALH